MGITQVCVSCHKSRQTTSICLILFAIVVFTAQGRTISRFIQVSQKDMRMMVAKPQIGSRPPKCEKRCSSCGHCEAVQVPVVPQIQTHRSLHYSSAAAAKATTTTVVTTHSSRSDDLSNYKPMSWKCKCGDYLFNP